jgi:hypothetical protein
MLQKGERSETAKTAPEAPDRHVTPLTYMLRFLRTKRRREHVRLIVNCGIQTTVIPWVGPVGHQSEVRGIVSTWCCGIKAFSLRSQRQQMLPLFTPGLSEYKNGYMIAPKTAV